MKGTPLSFEVLKLQSISDLTKQLVNQEIDKLVECPPPEEKSSVFVYRSKRHAVSWFVNYVVTEAAELDDEYVDGQKYYDFELRREIGCRMLEFRFYLHTRDLPGATEYSISIRKNGEFYACQE